jgi:hypothetical protein
LTPSIKTFGSGPGLILLKPNFTKHKFLIN